MRRLLREQAWDSTPACEALEDWLRDRPSLRKIAVYSALPGEVDLSSVPVRQPEIIWLYPRVIGDHLTFHEGGNLRPGAFGLLEPAGESPEIPLGEIDAFICPGLAFDTGGGRLGRGRGYYDRVLAQARPDALKIGVCFPQQIVTDTFPEPHDVKMDAVLC